MRGHTRTVFGVARLPDRQHIITCSDDASLRLWNLDSGAQIGNNWQENGDEGGVLTIALSPNSKTVASGSIGGAVKLWDVGTGKVTAKWTRHTNWVWSVRWSADGLRVASGSSDGIVRVWEMESGETVLGPIKTGNGYVFAVAYSPDSSNIATGGDKAIEIWDTTTGERLSTLQQDSSVWSLAWTSDQKKLIAGFKNGSIWIFNTTTWEQITILEGHTDDVNALSLFRNDRLLASASSDRTARLWNLDTNLPVGPPLQHQRPVWDAALSADGKSLVTACEDKNAYVWDTLTILRDSGFKDLLSVSNDVAGGKSILDVDATRRPKKPVIPRSAPLAFFEDTHDGIQTPDIPPAMTPADISLSADHSDPLASTTLPDSPPTHHHRRNIFPSFSVSGARSLLRRIFPHSRPRVNSSMNLPEQPSSPPLVSVHEPPDVQVPEEIVNELDATHRPSHDESHPQSIVDAQDCIHSSTTPTNRPPATPLTNLPPSLGRSVVPRSTSLRRPAIASSSVAGTRALLRPIFFRLRHSQSNTLDHMELQQSSASDAAPVHHIGHSDVQIPVVQRNQSGDTSGLARLEGPPRLPQSTVDRVQRHIHYNAGSSSECPARNIVPDHPPDIVEVPEIKARTRIYVHPQPKPKNRKRKDTLLARCIAFICCLPAQEGGGS